MEISVVIPVLNEEESIGELVTWINNVMVKNNYSYEVIFIDDGSTDDSWKAIEKLHVFNPHIKGIKFQRNYGKSAALNEGFARAKGGVVVTMDGDLQDSPDEIPVLYKMITEEGYDLVSGWKKERFDPITKTIPTKLFNAATRRMTGIRLHDFNCGLKAYRKNVVKSIEIYGEMHRYIPVLAKWAGFTKIGEKAVKHQARKYGKTKFGVNRFMNGFLDLLTISFVSRFEKRPMHLFGMLGTISFLLGFGILAYLTVSKIFWNVGNIDERPLFYFGILLLIVGTQLFVTGFLAELVSRSSADRNKYLIEKVIKDKAVKSL
jgi:glycosyltransferase involved in cell wall biosynthesis